MWSPKIGYGWLLDELQRRFILQLGDLGTDPVPNLLAFGYDWRRSNLHSAAELSGFLQTALGRWRESRRDPGAKVVIVGHSMGGLIARRAVTDPAVAGLVRQVVTVGTPFRGAASALLRLSGGLRVAGVPVPGLTEIARSLPSLHELLPRYDCVERGGRLVHHDTVSIEGVDRDLAEASGDLHRGLWLGDEPVDLRVLYGMEQPTPTTVTVAGDGLAPSTTIDGQDEGGDGTVPRLASRPPHWADVDPRRGGHVEQHGALPGHDGIFGKLWELLTGSPRTHRGPAADEPLGVAVPELLAAGEPADVTVTAVSGADRLRVVVQIHGPGAEIDESAGSAASPVARVTARNLGDGTYRAALPELAPGLYRVHVAAAGTAGPGVTALTTVVSAR